MPASKDPVCVSNYHQERRVKTIISLIFITFAAASFSFAQSGDGPDSVLMAKADREIPAVRNIITDREDPGDISLLTGSGENSKLTYESPSLNVEDLPLVMSSTDRKTVSIVLPPFLYFKQQF